MPRWALPGFVVGLWVMVTGGRVHWDAGGHADKGRALQWAFRARVRPRQYWWRERIDLLTDLEWDRVPERSLARIGLNSPDDIHCPLCGGEMTGVLTVAGPDVTAECVDSDWMPAVIARISNLEVHRQGAVSGPQVQWVRQTIPREAAKPIGSGVP